jgi:hypothetical protein
MRRAAGPAALAGCALLAAAGLRGQDAPLRQAGDYKSVEYFLPPHELQISSRITGAQAFPLPGSRLVRFIGFKLETYDTNGHALYIVEATNCVYDESDRIASSADHLKVRQADGQVTLEGDGFLWQQDENTLNISNHVYTIIKSGQNGPGLKLPP